MSNPWELYSSCAGWETASAALDASLASAIRNAHLARADGASCAQAAERARQEVEAVMAQYRDYGAEDSEPCRYLVRRLQREFGVCP